MQMASGADTVVDNHIGIAGDSWKPTHKEELSPHHSQHDSLRKRLEAERGYPRSQDEYLSYYKGKDKNAGWETPGYLSSDDEVANKGVEGAHTTKASWEIEFVDVPKYFYFISSRCIAVDAGNHPHTAYGGDHLYYAHHDGASWQYEIADASFNVGTNASIALDTSGHAHISYFDSINYYLKYATNASGSWIITIADSVGAGAYTSLVLVSRQR